MESEAIIVALIGALGASIAAAISRIVASKAWIAWTIIGAALGAGAAYLVLDYTTSELVNVALNKPARSSSSYQDNVAPRAVDGSTGTTWNAGAVAPQWLEVDLGSSYSIEAIELVVAQSPPGYTEHEVLIRTTEASDWERLFLVESETVNGQTLRMDTTGDTQSARYVRINTLKNPGWVAWIEARVFSSD